MHVNSLSNQFSCGPTGVPNSCSCLSPCLITILPTYHHPVDYRKHKCDQLSSICTKSQKLPSPEDQHEVSPWCIKVSMSSHITNPNISSADSCCILHNVVSLLKSSWPFMDTQLHHDHWLCCPFFLPPAPAFHTSWSSIKHLFWESWSLLSVLFSS